MRAFVYIISFLAVAFFSENLYNQESFSAPFINELKENSAENNHNLVRQFYTELQHNKSTSRELKNLLPDVEWTHSRNPARYAIPLSGILDNEWTNIMFKDMKFRSKDNHSILVTGIVNARRPTECELFSYSFSHLWKLKNGRIIHFQEY